MLTFFVYPVEWSVMTVDIKSFLRVVRVEFKIVSVMNLFNDCFKGYDFVHIEFRVFHYLLKGWICLWTAPVYIGVFNNAVLIE